MDPVKLIGDTISVLTILAVLAAVVWFLVSQVLPGVG